ncbi:MAG: GrpB family protein [Bacteroidales bacterium]|nr:GrpB family protein [Bacteroidales bacterium]
MSNEELGKLFPIIIEEPDPDWVKLFEKERNILEESLGSHTIHRIEHIGSTAVPGLKAKPTIDILLEIHDKTDTSSLIEKLTGLGYHYIPQPDNPPPYMMFAKGYSVKGFTRQAFHIHVRYPGDWDEIYFHDYLRQHAETAALYAELKIKLAAEYKNDRDGYTEMKGEFIKKITLEARKVFKHGNI